MHYETKIHAPSRGRGRLAFNLQLKELGPQGRFAGYASVFNIVDSQRDVVTRGAFARTLKGRVKDIKFL